MAFFSKGKGKTTQNAPEVTRTTTHVNSSSSNMSLSSDTEISKNITIRINRIPASTP